MATRVWMIAAFDVIRMPVFSLRVKDIPTTIDGSFGMAETS